MRRLTGIVFFVFAYLICESRSLSSGDDITTSSTPTTPYLILITASGKEILVHNRTADLQNEDYFNASDPIREAHIHGL